MYDMIMCEMREGKTCDIVRPLSLLYPDAVFSLDPKSDDLNPTLFRLQPQPQERADDRPEGEADR